MSITLSDKLELILKNYWIIKDNKGLVEGTRDYDSFSYNIESFFKQIFLNLLKPNACQTIIDILLSNYDSESETEKVNNNNIFIPGAILNTSFTDESLAEKNFIKQIFINDFSMNKFLESGTNYVLIDPSYFRNSYMTMTGDFNLERDETTFKAINIITKYVEDCGNTIISQSVISTDTNQGTIYEICVDRKGCNTNKIYIVGSCFYLSYVIKRVLNEIPNMYKSDKARYESLEGFTKERYLEFVDELNTKYDTQIDRFKLLIEKSTNFFLFNCIQFVSAAVVETKLFSINSSFEKFIADNDLSNKVNYFNLIYTSDYIYNYIYKSPIIIRNKIRLLNLVDDTFEIKPEKKIIIPNMSKYLDDSYFGETSLDDDNDDDKDSSDSSDSTKKKKNIMELKLNHERKNKNDDKDKDDREKNKNKNEGGYYAKYMKYKLKYLRIKNQL
jgi:hypothetical protein